MIAKLAKVEVEITDEKFSIKFYTDKNTAMVDIVGVMRFRAIGINPTQREVFTQMIQGFIKGAKDETDD